MARVHRGLGARILCNECAPGDGSVIITPRRRRLPPPGQMSLALVEEIQAIPPFLLQALVTLGPHTSEGDIVVGVTIPWFEIIRQLRLDPLFLYQVPWRRLEELIAGAYEREGWKNVALTPRSADGGKDVIAESPHGLTIRILDQVKAYGPDQRVTANDVRALLGVLSVESNVSKGLVTTTADFAPGIASDPNLMRFVPNRLELRDGGKLRQWLLQVAGFSDGV